MLFLVKKTLVRHHLIALCSLLSMSAHAVEFHVDGFASIVAGKATHQAQLTDGSDTDYLASTPQGFYRDDWDLTPDSVLGLQVIAQFNDTFSLTGQVTSEGQNDFDLDLEWAYLTYHMRPNTRFLIGRQRLPLFYFSDFLDVGYAYHFIRPPQEVYDLPFDDLEGIQMVQSFNLDDWDGQFHLYVGNTQDTLADPIKQGQLEDIFGSVFSMGNDWIRFRASYLQGDLSSNNISRGGIRQDDNNAIKTTFLGLAVEATIDDIILLSEVIRIQFDDPIGPDQGLGGTQIIGWYLSVGYQFDDFTPYIVYAENSLDIDQENILLRLNGLDDQDLSSTAWTVGLRWDFMQQVALKAEYITRRDVSSRNFRNITGKSREIDLFTLGFDVIF